MWDFVEHIPRDSLGGWFRWLTIFTIGLPVLGAIAGGLCGWGAFLVSDRIGNLQTAELAEAKKSATEANERAAAAQSALRESKAPRYVTPEHEAAIIKRLTPIPKGPVAVSPAMIDSTDAKPFSDQISEILTKSGFILVKPPKDYLSYNTPGAFLMVRDINHPPLYAIEIHNAFKDEAGVILLGVSKPEDISDNAMVVIAVSSHP